MLPREFTNVYGRPVTRTVVIPLLSTLAIPPNEDRYLFYIWASNLNLRVFLESDDGTTSTGFIVAANIGQLRLTHALDGGMVNLGFNLFAEAGDTTVKIVEGFMVPPTPTAMRVKNGKANDKAITPDRHRRESGSRGRR